MPDIPMVPTGNTTFHMILDQKLKPLYAELKAIRELIEAMNAPKKVKDAK